MQKGNFKSIVGLMSGTSLDGLDLCYVNFWGDFDNPEFEIIATETYSYSNEWVKKLKQAIMLKPDELLILDSKYGAFLGEKVLQFLKEKKIEKPDWIASHGHTVFHQPEEKLTKQIGNGRSIQLKTGIPVVCDFRTQDVLLGGQGAPLVPIGDKLLFSSYPACLNLGGFANISLELNNERLAFDICPANILLNYLANKLNKTYDKNGEISRKGKPIQSITNQLNKLNFYNLNPPKSLGYEWLESEVLPQFNSHEYSTEDLLNTAIEHITGQISKILNQYKIKKVLCSGGGVKNKFLMEKLNEKFLGEVVIPKEEIIDFKEALCFAFLAWLRIYNQKNVLASATGAPYNHSAGEIFS